MSGDDIRWFSSKVDWWFAVVLVLLVGGVLASAIATIVGDRNVIVGLLPVAFVGGLLGGLVFPMRYGIGERELLIHHGLVRQRCLLSEIVEVYPTRNPLSSPALSLDRLMIRKGEGFFGSIMISPADKAGFLALLQERTGLSRQGDRLVRG